MKVTVTGGLGFLGRLLARRLAQDGWSVTLFDQPGPAAQEGSSTVRGEVTDAAAVSAAIPAETDLVVHLASMVSAECELDFDRAFQVNVSGLRVVLDRCRQLPRPPTFLFASSVAVFGGAESGVGDQTKQSPTTTYGVTKAIGELLVSEYTRKGFIDGRTARLPTVIIRPGRPNAAASSFASGLFREPLNGERSIVPVAATTPMVLIGHRAAISGLARLATLQSGELGADRAIGLPGLEVTVQDMISVARSRPETTGSIEVRPDAAIEAVVGSWPGRWDASQGRALGLAADESLHSIVEDYLSDFATRH